MALTINATLSSETANSFADLAYAADYFDSHPNTVKRDTWAALTDEQQTVAMIMAATMLNRLTMTDKARTFPTLGQRVVLGDFYPYAANSIFKAKWEQRLQLPRNIDQLLDGTYHMPDEAKMAQCEQAVYISNLDESALEAQRQGLFRDSLSADSVSLSSGFTGRGDAYAPMAVALIGPLLRRQTVQVGR